MPSKAPALPATSVPGPVASGLSRSTTLAGVKSLPAWLPDAVRLYLDHTEDGHSLRSLARREGCAASTVMRKVRRYENRRDDPLVDEALAALGRVHKARVPAPEKEIKTPMSAQFPADHILTDEAMIAREARRILRRLAEPGAVLAIAPDMEKAAVLRALPDGRTARTGVVDRSVAQAFALKDWIVCQQPGRVSSYQITASGRAALRRLQDSGARRMHADEAAEDWSAPEDGTPRLRYSVESPVAALGRRLDKSGKPFLSPDLVDAAERLREDFELAQMGPRVAQNWDRFLTAGDRGTFRSEGGPADGPRAARERVARALADLGPGLGDMVLRCCCYLEGLEAAEKRMGWSARSGKIVLRIALQRLKRHYEELYGRAGPLIG
jgi:transposase-like protein